MDKMKWTFFCFLTILFISSLCSAQSDSAHSEQACNISFSSLEGLPELVLVGTDVVELSSFGIAKINNIKKEYSAEFGGATSTLKISQNKNEKKITRLFKEPGMKEEIVIYSPYCAKERFVSAENLKAIIVSDGLLLLEEKSKVDGIPSNLWVYYKPN
jgi:hypothetical protein